MKQFTKFLLLGMTLALLSALVLPIAAQSDPGAGEGGTIVLSNIGDDPATINPILSNDTVASAITARIYPNLLGYDPVTLDLAPGANGGLAASWEYDETGTILTLNLRQDLVWGDGTPITSADYIWAADAVRSNLTSSPRTYVFYTLADGTLTNGPIHSYAALDEYTLQFRLGDVVTDEAGEVVLDADGNPELKVNCDAIYQIDDISVAPAHVFGSVFGTDYASMDADPYFLPETETGIATWGIWTEPFIEAGVQVSLVADQNYPDTQLGYVAPGEWLQINVEDTNVEFERFLAGDFTLISVAASRQNGIRGDERFQFIEWPQSGYTYMGFNLADPNNPQPGRDEAGNLLPQGLHPVFGDVNVRRAIAHAIDVVAMIGTRPEGDQPATGILEGNGYAIATHNHPLSTVEPGVEPYAFDPALAAEMLEAAGWVDTDGDNVRECRGCLYATEVDSAYEGTPMQFELLTNAGNRLRESAGETIRQQLAEVGITVNFQAIEFGTLVDELTSQTADAIIIGWSLSIPFNAGQDIRQLFGPDGDIPGAGFAFTSYQNAEMEALAVEGDTLAAAEDGSYAACDPDRRNELYAEALRMLYNDVPYVWLYQGNVMTAAQGTLGNFDPLPYNASWNEDAWAPGG